MGQFFRAQYDKEEMHRAVRNLDDTIAAHGISKIEASLRWVCFHSALRAEDGVILGASSAAQLAQNLEGIARGPLPEEVATALDALWLSISGKAT